jgi:hypothetical protein
MNQKTIVQWIIKLVQFILFVLVEVERMLP